jgi:hypothetical protein
MVIYVAIGPGSNPDAHQDCRITTKTLFNYLSYHSDANSHTTTKAVSTVTTTTIDASTVTTTTIDVSTITTTTTLHRYSHQPVLFKQLHL